MTGTVPASAQSELRDTLREQGYFLACQCLATQDMTISLPSESELFSPATIVDKTLLSPDICKLLIEPATPLYYHAGQFINVRRDDGTSRSYSLASVPRQDSHLEVHVRRHLNGAMSTWVFDSLMPGHRISIQGPMGSCFYLDNSPDAPLLLIGTGTGLAPLLGILRDALHSGHQGPIHLYHGSRDVAGLYCGNELHALARRYDNVHYTPCVSQGPAPAGYTSGRANDIALANHASLKGWRVYLCGAPPMVNTTRKLAFLVGARLADIYADAFETKDLRTRPRE